MDGRNYDMAALNARDRSSSSAHERTRRKLAWSSSARPGAGNAIASASEPLWSASEPLLHGVSVCVCYNKKKEAGASVNQLQTRASDAAKALARAAAARLSANLALPCCVS